MSKIAIIGYGNVGYHLANRLSKRNEVSIFSRNASESEIHSFDALRSENFDFVLLCVPDGAVKEVAQAIKPSNAIVMHTSGSRPLSDLEDHPNHGVLYPLQTFSVEKTVDFSTFPVFVEGNETAEMKIYSFARSFATDVRLLSSANRVKLHLAAVFACNFSNHMYHIAEKYLNELDMKFQDFQPLVEETLNKALAINPSKAQTGPAMRGDASTLAVHRDMIKDEEIRKMYELISKHIQQLS